jgi:histidyl-tRNA synthetase
VATELYPDASKMKKQMSYANARGIPFVVIVGEEEMTSGRMTVKDMQTGEQTKLTPDELVSMMTTTD